MESGGVEWSKILTLVIGCIAKFTTGSLFSFNVYQDAIKDTFNYTQKEVEVMSSMLNLGLGIGFLPGMFYDRFGPRGTSAISLVVSVTAYLLLWSTTRSIHFYANNSWLMAFYFFTCGFGSVFTYMAALNTNLINFDRRHAGKIVGLLNASFSGSASVFAAIYYKFFVPRNPDDFKNQNFAGFMLMFAILFGVVDVFCILFLRIIVNPNEQFTQLDEETDTQDESVRRIRGTATVSYNAYNDIGIETASKGEVKLASDRSSGVAKVSYDPFSDSGNGIESEGDIPGNSDDVSTESHRTQATHSDKPLTLKDILVQMDYQLIIWMFAFASCVALVFGNNITVISRSLHLEQYNNRLTIIIPITSAIVSLCIGFFSDYFIERISRLTIVIVACCISLCAQMIVVSYANVLWLLVVATTLTGLSMSTLWSIAPTIMRERFYVGNIGRNWGVAILLAAVLGFGSQTLFGALYDDKITEVGETHCYGMKCIQSGTGVLICLNVISIVLGVCLYIKTYYPHTCR